MNNVVILQMGKVGSTALKDSLNLYIKDGRNVIHLHRTKDKKKIAELSGNSLYVTPIREPVSRNISGFFQHVEKLYPNLSKMGIGELKREFITTYNHLVPLVWFDEDFYPITGVDVYQYSFDKEKKYITIGDVLIFDSSLSNGAKEKLLRNFLKNPQIKIKNAHVTSERWLGNIYTKFKQEVKLPIEYLDWMLNSKYAKHFFTDQELESIYRRWKE